jgi:hypothetical protein
MEIDEEDDFDVGLSRPLIGDQEQILFDAGSEQRPEEHDA